MRPAVLLAVLAALAAGASVALQGPLPGDVAATRALQSALGHAPAWADWLTDTAKAPLLWGTLMVAALLAWRCGGWRGAVAVPLAYAFAFGADMALRAVLSVPRPDPALVAVTAPAASSGLPSTFGLVYGALLGAALLLPGASRRAHPARLAAGVLLLAGATARIVLGGHWPSQMLASVAFGLLLAIAAGAVIRRLPVSARA